MFTGKMKRVPLIWAFFPTVVFVIFMLSSPCMNSASAAVTPSVASRSPFLRSIAWTRQVNPAERYCLKVGGSLAVRTRGDGRAYELCQFPDNRACEAWALWRGDCPIGGVKTTGFDTIAQAYCAWLGGKTLALPHATCTLPNGKVCDDNALYNGLCDAPVSKLERHVQ